MFRKMLFVGSAIVLAAPAFASPQQSPRGGSPAGAAMDARVNSRGALNASPRAIERANSNSVLAQGSVAADMLPGLTTGLTVQSSTGTTLGTVSQVVTGTDGSIRLVIVTSPTGETIRLAPSTLTISGGVVTTTSVGD